MSSIYQEMKDSSIVPIPMDLSVMEQKYHKEGMDPIETNTTMIREELSDRNVRYKEVIRNVSL